MASITALLATFLLIVGVYNPCMGQGCPTLTSIYPPSGLSNQQPFQITGTNLNGVASVDPSSGSVTITTQNDTTIVFTITSSSGVITVTLEPTLQSCNTLTDTIAVKGTKVSFSFGSNVEGQPGTVIFIEGCFPPTCGDNSTLYSVTVGGIVAELLDDTEFGETKIPESQFYIRLGQITTPIPDATVTLVSQYSIEYDSGSSTIDYRLSGNVTSVSPSTGQRGTEVSIAGTNLIGLEGNLPISLANVSLGGIQADSIINATQTLIRVKITSGMAGLSGLELNSTQLSFFSMKPISGPSNTVSGLWTYLDDGSITQLVPPAAQEGATVYVCGSSILGGGTSVSSVSVVGVNLSSFSSGLESLSASELPNECISATVPAPSGPLPQEGVVEVTANTQALVTSADDVSFKYANVSLISPDKGQEYTFVTITGIHLLSGYNETEVGKPTVAFGSKEATVESYTETEIVVQVLPSPGEINSLIDVRITVTKFGLNFTVELSQGWTYLKPGSITSAEPNFGQSGTRITLNGIYLLGYGVSLDYVSILGSDSSDVDSDAHVNGTLVEFNDTVVVIDMPIPVNSDYTGPVDILLVADNGAQIQGGAVFEYMEQGEIIAVLPSEGQRGTYVIISGTNLFGYGTNVTQVKLGDAIADILFEETTSSSVKIRATALEVTQTTPVDITLISDTNAMVVSNNKPFSYLQEGSVASVLPNIGQIGTIVNITGAGLLGGGASIEQIFLDGVEPASITSQTSDKIVVTLDDRNNRDPDFYPGEIYIESDTGAIVVGGSFTHKAPGNITSVTPTEGRVGTEIVITGYNLTGFGNFIETVFVGDYEVSSLVGFTTTEGDSMLIIEAPDGLGGHSSPVKLYIDTGATIISSQSFTFTESGNITTVTPNSGAEGRGVLIEGKNLIVNDLDITSLTIGGSEVSRIVTQSSSQISFIAGSSPNGSKTDQPIRVTLSDGSFTEGGAFTYEDYPLTIIGTDRGQFGTSTVLKVPFLVDDVVFVKFDGVTADIIETDSNNSTVTVEAPRGQEFGNHSVDVTVENRDNIIARLKEGFTYITEGIICTVSPSEGQRGTRVRILGENLLGGGSEITKVTFGSITGTIDSFSNKEINVSLRDNPDTYPMTVDIQVVSNTGAVTTHVEGFTLIQPGVITSVTPSSGQYGTVVTITGTGLLEGDQELVSIKLAGTDADIIGTPNDTVIVVSAGTSNATIGLVSIVTATGAEILSDQTNKFEYLTQSDITSVSPMNGTEGTRVKIYGENMLGGGSSVSSVKLGDVTAKEVVDGSNTEITVIAASGGNLTAGPGDIVITSNTGAIVTLNEAWIHTELGNITSVSPLSGQQGVIVTIEGDRLLASNNDGIASVTIAGIAATINEQSSTAIVVEAGYSSIGQSGPIVLELESGPVITSSVNFTYYAAYIDTVSPAKGTNGTYVTITGKNIVGEPNTSDSVSTVTFNGVPCYDIQTLTVDSVRVRAGYYSMPGTMVDVMINSTSGAYLSVNNGWEYQYNGDIQSVEPATVIPGDNITITGTQLVPDNATSVEVTIGETDSFTAYIINISMVTVRVGVYSSEDEPGMDLPVHVIANDGSTVISNGDVFSFKQTTIADTVIPYAGQTGTVVVINGSNLFDENDGPVDVYLAGVKAQVTDFTPTSVTVMAGNGPAEGVGGSVTVVNGNGTFTGLGGTAWTYLPELTTEHVSPLSGRNGTIVTVDVTSVPITFQLQSVYLGDIQADIISNIDGYVKLSVVHSDEASNVGNITLNYQDGIILSIRDAWTYQVPISVNQNSTLKGYYNSEVAITGKGFRSGDADIPVASVSLAGFETEIISQTDTRLVLKIIDNYDSNNSSMEGPIVIISNDEAQYYSTTDNITFTYVQVRVESVSPVLGEKGTRVTISGIGLLAGDDNVSTVTLAGVEVMNIDSVSDNAIVVLAGGYDNNTEPDDITYTMGSGAVVTITSTWSYVALGEITILTPTSGSKGTLVNIIGERLLGGGVKADTVYLNGVEALEVIVSDDQLVQVRAGESSPKLGGEVKIVADTGAILVSTGNEQYFEYTQSGVIDTVTPSSGQFGTVVTITGVDLHRGADINSITIAGVEAIVTNYSSTVVELIVQRPPTTSSFEGLIAIESDYRTLIESSANFTYLREGDITSVQPAQGQYRTQVVIGGNRLYGGGTVIMSVLLAGIPAHVITQSDIEIRVRANDSFSSDSQDVSGDIVLISDSGAQVSLIDSWTYVQVGMIDSVSPQSGQYGTRVTITGERLTAGGVSVQSVVINGVGSLEVLSSSSTEVVFRAGEPNNPSPSSGTIQLVSNDYGEFNSQVLWNYTAASQVYEVLPANGTGGSVIMIIGDNLLGGISLNVSSVEIVGININRVVSQNDTVIEVEVGFNPDGQEKEGDITIETTSGSIIHLENGWKYLNECPIGQFGNNTNSCSICDTQCVHCYGPTDYDCYSCQNFKIIANSEMQCVMKCPSLSTLDKECVNACGTDQFQEIRLDNNTYCIDCHEQCNPNLGCTGITNTLSHCTACLNVELDGICIEACPLGYYVENGTVCMPCNEQCTPEAGCRGPEAYECNECLNVTIYKNAEQVDECIPSCPGNYYTDFTGFCRQCHSQCNGGCDGPYPSDCYQCKNVFVEHTGCVEECPDPNRYFVNETGHCVRCHEYCSTTNSSCNGPDAKDCDNCLNFTGSNTNADEFFPRFEGECMRECLNISYYVELMTGDCMSCHQSCTMGCKGSSETDCIVVGVSATVSTPPTEEVAAGNFTAGIGTIGLVVCVIVVLFLVMLIVIVVLGCKLNKGNGKVKGTYLFAENAENTVVQMTTTTFNSHSHGNNGDTHRPGDYVRPSSINPIFQSDPLPSYIEVNSDLPSSNGMPEIDEPASHSQTMSEAYMEMEYDYKQKQKEKQSEPSVPPPSLPPKSARLSSGDPSLPQVHPRLTNQRQSGKFHKPPALPPPQQLTFVDDDSNDNDNSTFLTSGGNSMELLTQDEYEEPFVALSTLPRLPPSLSTLSSLSRQGSVPAPPTSVQAPPTSVHTPPTSENIYEVSDDDSGPLYEETGGNNGIHQPLPSSVSMPQVPPAIPDRPGRAPPLPSRSSRTSSASTLPSRR